MFFEFSSACIGRRTVHNTKKRRVFRREQGNIKARFAAGRIQQLAVVAQHEERSKTRKFLPQSGEKLPASNFPFRLPISLLRPSRPQHPTS